MRDIHTVHLISHTHWDREWYLNSPYTNEWLVPFFDALFRMLARQPRYRFVLDGQTAMIEDCIERLERAGRDVAAFRATLGQYAREQRLLLGPYYLQPDWQLVSEEALVRNLLIGGQIAAEYGGTLRTGWLLDNFGQISQAPQIHREFGLRGVYVWRGVEMDPNHIRSEFLWQGPDGTVLVAVYLLSSYRNAMRLAAYPASMSTRIRTEAGKLAPFATTPNVLLMNGYDQEMDPDDLQPHLAGNALDFDGVHVVQSTPDEYLDAIVSHDPALPTLRGALYSGRYIAVFPGILSSRMYIKTLNDACQRHLEKSAEPFATAAWALGYDYPAPALLHAWKLLLKNHPHDSICGVSIDDVHTDMEHRLAACASAAQAITRDALAAWTSAIDTSRITDAQSCWIAFNGALTARRGVVAVNTPLPAGTALLDDDGHPIPVQTNGQTTVFACTIPPLGYRILHIVPARRGDPSWSPSATPSPNATPSNPAAPDAGPRAMGPARRGDPLWSPNAAPSNPAPSPNPASPDSGPHAMGQAHPAEERATSGPAPTDPPDTFRDRSVRCDPQTNTLENAFVHLTVHPDGSLALFDKQQQVTYSPLGIFEDGADAGDEYTYSPPRRDQILTTRASRAEITFLETGPLRATVRVRWALSLPERLDPDRDGRSHQVRAMPGVTLLILESESPVVRFRTQIFNTVQDHRVRVLFSTGIRTERSHAETQFDVVSRPITPHDYDDTTIPDNVRQIILGAREPRPATTFPQRAFVDLHDGTRGLAVLNRGLPEYEILPEHNTIALTLVRAVRWIARADLTTRTGDAGPLIATPDAECLRPMALNYALLSHAGDWERGRVVRQADEFNSAVTVIQTGTHGGSLPGTGSLLALQDSSEQLKVTAVKRSEDGRALIVRCHNPAETPLDAHLVSLFKVRRAAQVSLAEQNPAEIPVVDGHRIAISAPPKKILTLYLEIERGDASGGARSEDVTWVSENQDSDPAWPDPVETVEPVTAEDMQEEEQRAADLGQRLEETQQRLDAYRRDHAAAGAPLDPPAENQLQLQVETVKRAYWEARLSAVLLHKKYAEIRRAQGGTAEAQAWEATLREIGLTLNRTRVSKRALEYVVDSYRPSNQL